MFSSILNTLIACVVVILVLSLIVQAVQTALKKVLRLKSRQIEDSLVDLFQNALNQTENKLFKSHETQGGQATAPTFKEKLKSVINRVPMLRLVLGHHPSELAA